MSWSDLDQRKRRAEESAVDPIDEIMAGIFSTEDGMKVMLWLRKKTKERVLPASEPESALRALEGMRHLVHEIETRVARGRKEDDAGRYRDQLARNQPKPGRQSRCGCIACRTSRGLAGIVLGR